MWAVAGTVELGIGSPRRRAFEIANISVYHALQNEYPLFLIDDIDAELDSHRIGQLLEYLVGKTQTIVTTSKQQLAAEIGAGGELIHVRKGYGDNVKSSLAAL
jgi:recombinational DNA repair ATPase RecF